MRFFVLNQIQEKRDILAEDRHLSGGVEIILFVES